MYRTILFDVDGVLLSEERYFDASALCVWELLGSPQYLGLDLGFTPAPDEPTIRRVRRAVFADDRVLSFIKSRGLNSNWDMVFLTFSFQLLLLLEQLAREDRAFVRDVLSGPIDRDVLREIGARAGPRLYAPVCRLCRRVCAVAGRQSGAAPLPQRDRRPAHGRGNGDLFAQQRAVGAVPGSVPGVVPGRPAV
ncbi:hypothetical protein [Calditerricola satsumensis]|uniref:hypothetical protein n=1 Tax=Calditerricola satsumensis TaxID=373054 RepID=UPI000B1007ED|nr:hypothetical protein [Calditerricola satsumensis]